jgi:hypothetical protein
MTNHEQRNTAYIALHRNTASAILDSAEDAPVLQGMWNNEFGGAAALVDSDFRDSNAGLVKADIEAALAAFSALNTWLDEPGMARRSSLQKIRFIR